MIKSLSYSYVIFTLLVDKEKNSDDERTDDDKETSDRDNNNNIPGFSQFLYFLFAPTLVYRDHYPQ